MWPDELKTLRVVPKSPRVDAAHYAGKIAAAFHKVRRYAEAVGDTLVVEDDAPVDVRCVAMAMGWPVSICWPCGCRVGGFDSHECPAAGESAVA
jgi:hypothetical protein